MQEKNKYIFRAVLTLLLAGGILYYFFFAQEPDVLIRGVPYLGNFSGIILSTSQESVAAMITRYWGDQRLSMAEVRKRLQDLGVGERPLVRMDELAVFFDRQGYETKIEQFREIHDFQKYLRENIPPIIALRLPTQKYFLVDHSVLIGFLPSKRIVILHSNLLGNNYEMSFEDFERSWDGRQRAVLLVKPSDKIKDVIEGPDRVQDYPERLGIMDDSDLRELAFKWKWTTEAAMSEGNKAALWEEIISDPAFVKLRPTGQIWAYLRLAKTRANLGQVDEAIVIVEEKAMPLNHNIEKAFGEWPAFRDFPPNSEWIRPWVALGELYIRKGNLQKARVALERAIKIDPEDRYTKAQWQELERLMQKKR